MAVGILSYCFLKGVIQIFGLYLNRSLLLVLTALCIVCFTNTVFAESNSTAVSDVENNQIESSQSNQNESNQSSNVNQDSIKSVDLNQGAESLTHLLRKFIIPAALVGAIVAVFITKDILFGCIKGLILLTIATVAYTMTEPNRFQNFGNNLFNAIRGLIGV